jgi:GNAT superfamily N-acetyltransferase
MDFYLEPATAEHAAAIAALRTAVAESLTAQYGEGHWSGRATERGVLFDLRHSRVYMARQGGRVVATLNLLTKKPWAIDKTYFTPGNRPLYLTSMAVDPGRQRQGIGRLCLDEIRPIAKGWPADAIRLDAYDAAAGAGEFYRKCGYREVGRVTYRDTPLVYFELLV